MKYAMFATTEIGSTGTGRLLPPGGSVTVSGQLSVVSCIASIEQSVMIGSGKLPFCRCSIIARVWFASPVAKFEGKGLQTTDNGRHMRPFNGQRNLHSTSVTH